MINNIRNSLPPNKIFLSIIFPLFLLLIGIIYCLYYGRVAYMPLDSPIVFDGGWRILSGQIPFRDFTLPNAIIPIFLQAFFFKIFGVNWFVYCLHAAIFNGLFCVLVFFFFRIFGGRLLLSFFYALLSGVIFYTPFGVPIQDQHAFFFTFLLIFLTCLSIHVSNPFFKQLLFFFIPIVTIIAFLSKQIPTAFGAVLALAILLFTERRNLFVLTRSLLAGALVAGIILCVLYYALGINFELLKVYFFQIPAETGIERVTKIFSERWIGVLKQMVDLWPLFLPFGLVTILFLGALPLAFKDFVISDTKSFWKALAQEIKNDFFPLFLAESLLIISFLFMIMTNNQIQNGVPLTFISLGLTHLFLLDVFSQVRHNDSNFRLVSQKSILFLISIILCIISLWVAWNFDRKVNATRIVHDLRYTEKDAESPKQKMPEPLSFLVWKTPKAYSGEPKDFLRIIDFFQHNEGNFYLLGDSSVLYALTGRDSVNPILWFHPGQTLPYRTSPLFPAFQNRLMQTLQKYNVRYIVLESTWGVKNNLSDFSPGITWGSVNLSYFPSLHELAMKKGHERERFGPFVVIELIKSSNMGSVKKQK